MNDFNEDVTNILNSIKSLYKGCEGIKCEECQLYSAKFDSIEENLCNYFMNKTNFWRNKR